MPLATAKNPVPEVKSPAVITNVGDGAAVKEGRDRSTVRGQIRTHLVAHSMPSLLTTVDLTNDESVKALINKMVEFVETGK